MKGTCPMAKIGQHFVGMLWTEKEHISGVRRYVQHARPGGHIEERPLAVAQAEPTGGVARKPRYPTGASEAGDPARATNRRLAPPVPAARPTVRGVRRRRPENRDPRRRYRSALAESRTRSGRGVP